jgi:hypothetical protein
MLGSQALETLIGLVLMFFVISLAASSIEAATGSRGSGVGHGEDGRRCGCPF